MSRASERDLIRRARRGDEDAFVELVEMYAGRVYGALRRFGLDASEADEVAQEVFVRAWRGLPSFEERARLSTWLYRIAFNEAQRRLSRRGPRQGRVAWRRTRGDRVVKPVSGTRMCRILKKHGWVLVRKKGSHRAF